MKSQQNAIRFKLAFILAIQKLVRILAVPLSTGALGCPFRTGR